MRIGLIHLIEVLDIDGLLRHVGAGTLTSGRTRRHVHGRAVLRAIVHLLEITETIVLLRSRRRAEHVIEEIVGACGSSGWCRRVHAEQILHRRGRSGRSLRRSEAGRCLQAKATLLLGWLIIARVTFLALLLERGRIDAHTAIAIFFVPANVLGELLGLVLVEPCGVVTPVVARPFAVNILVGQILRHLVVAGIRARLLLMRRLVLLKVRVRNPIAHVSEQVDLAVGPLVKIDRLDLRDVYAELSMNTYSSQTKIR